MPLPRDGSPSKQTAQTVPDAARGYRVHGRRAGGSAALPAAAANRRLNTLPDWRLTFNQLLRCAAGDAFSACAVVRCGLRRRSASFARAVEMKMNALPQRERSTHQLPEPPSLATGSSAEVAHQGINISGDDPRHRQRKPLAMPTVIAQAEHLQRCCSGQNARSFQPTLAREFRRDVKQTRARLTRVLRRAGRFVIGETLRPAITRRRCRISFWINPFARTALTCRWRRLSMAFSGGYRSRSTRKKAKNPVDGSDIDRRRHEGTKAHGRIARAGIAAIRFGLIPRWDHYLPDARTRARINRFYRNASSSVALRCRSSSARRPILRASAFICKPFKRSASSP